MRDSGLARAAGVMSVHDSLPDWPGAGQKRHPNLLQTLVWLACGNEDNRLHLILLGSLSGMHRKKKIQFLARIKKKGVIVGVPTVPSQKIHV